MTQPITSRGFRPSFGRPDLLTLAPERLLPRLREGGVDPRLLAWQQARRQPDHGWWGVLPVLRERVIIDLTYQSAIGVAMTLTDLVLVQRSFGVTPIVIVPHDAYAAQRLITSARLSAIAVATDTPASTIARWLEAPVQIAEVAWVGITPPTSPSRSTHFVPLLAALARATSVQEAADWCALSRRRAYEVLADASERLCLLHRSWRTTQQWVSALSRAVATSPRPVGQPESNREAYRKEQRMEATFRPFDVIAANLCDCVVDQIHVQGERITLDLDEPRMGALTLVCKDSAIVNAADYADFAQRPVWARKINWVDVLDDNTLQLYFANGTNLALRTQVATFEWP
jgi:hypothetical protein